MKWVTRERPKLRQKGIDAAIIGCGMAGWRAIGAPTTPKS